MKVCRRIRPGHLVRKNAHWHYLRVDGTALCNKHHDNACVQGSDMTWEPGPQGQQATCPGCLKAAAKLFAA